MTNEILEEFSKFQEDMLLGRITSVHKSLYLISSNKVLYKGKMSGRFSYTALSKSDYPVVGDYVIFMPSIYDDSATIEKVCTRHSKIERLGVGTAGDKQILAANIDLIYICVSLNEDFNIKKIQNFISTTYGSNAEAIVLLTKKDLCDNIEDYTNQVKKLNKNIEIMVVSSYSKEDILLLEEKLKGKTSVFIGSSGVGKSTLINQLLGYDYLKTLDIRLSDAQGKHATTHREMIELPRGGYIIDTPGLRVINSYIVGDALENFDEISELSQDCLYNDCTHIHEPNCKVREALNNGEISTELFNSYRNILRLNRYNQRRELERKRVQNKRKKR